MAKIIKFPEQNKDDLPPEVQDMDDFELLRYLYYGVRGFDDFEDERQHWLRSIYWRLYDRLLLRK